MNLKKSLFLVLSLSTASAWAMKDGESNNDLERKVAKESELKTAQECAQKEVEVIEEALSPARMPKDLTNLIVVYKGIIAGIKLRDKFDAKGFFPHIHVFPNGTFMIAGDGVGRGNIKVFSKINGVWQTQKKNTKQDKLSSLTVSQDGTVLSGSYRSNDIALWKQEGKSLKKVQGSDIKNVKHYRAILLRNGDIVSENSGVINVIDSQTKKTKLAIPYGRSTDTIEQFLELHDGRLVGSNRDGHIIVFDFKAKKDDVVRVMNNGFDAIYLKELPHDILLVGSEDGIRFWNTRTMVQESSIELLNDKMTAVGNDFAVTAHNNALRLFDFGNRTQSELTNNNIGNPRFVRDKCENVSLAVSPDQKTVYSGRGNTITLWDLEYATCRKDQVAPTAKNDAQKPLEQNAAKQNSISDEESTALWMSGMFALAKEENRLKAATQDSLNSRKQDEKKENK